METTINLHDDDLLLDNLSWFVRVAPNFHSFPLTKFNLISNNNTNSDPSDPIIYDEIAILAPINSQLLELIYRIVIGFSQADEQVMKSPPTDTYLPLMIHYQLSDGLLSSFIGERFKNIGLDYHSEFKGQVGWTEKFVECKINGKSTSNKVIIIGFGITPYSRRFFVTVNGILAVIQQPGFEISDMTNEELKGFSFVTIDARNISSKLPNCKIFKPKRQDWIFSIQKNLELAKSDPMITNLKGITLDTIISLKLEYEMFANIEGCKEITQQILCQSEKKESNSTKNSTNSCEILGGLICEDACFNIISFLDGIDVMKISFLNKYHFNLITLESYPDLFETTLSENTRISMNEIWKQNILNRWIHFQVFNEKQNFYKIFKRRFVRVDHGRRFLVTVDGCAKLETNCPIVLNFQPGHEKAFCGVCRQTVYQTSDLSELVQHAKEGLCVSYSPINIELAPTNNRGRLQGCFVI